MYCIDLDKYLLGAVAKTYSPKEEYTKKLNFSNEHVYFASGNLLIDCQGFRNNNIVKKIFEIEKKYRPFLRYADQDILNICFDHNYKKLDWQFCFETSYFRNSKICSDNIVIRHFEAGLKPWQISQELKTDLMPNKEDFWRYAKVTSFYSELKSKTIYNTNKDLIKFKVFNMMRDKNV